jgi:peroxiredoxin
VQKGPEVGESAPEIRLPDLKGTNVALEDFLDDAYAVCDAFGVGGTSSAVLIHANGRIASER